MASIHDILNIDPVELTASVSKHPIVEPLGSPGSVDAVMDRFSDSVYQQGKDSRLYRFITALCGDSGAGVLRKQAFAARLGTEAEVLKFQELDSFYVQHFRFRRLSTELYTLDPASNYVTPEELNDIQNKDDKYRHRLQDFFKGLRYGGSPKGLELIARAGSGIPAEVIEGYEWIFDKYSDDGLGLTSPNSMPRINGFDVNSHALNLDGTPTEQNTTYTATNAYIHGYTVNAPTYGVVTTKDALRAGLTPASQTDFWFQATQTYILPQLERNMVDLLDRIRPVGAMMNVNVVTTPFRNIPIDQLSTFASSENFIINRYVTGKPLSASEWPPVNRASGTFIVPGEEHEALTAHHLHLFPVTFHTTENVRAYSYEALSRVRYNNRQWYEFAEYLDDLSRHIGTYSKEFAAIFPMLRDSPSELEYVESLALAAHDTALTLEARYS